MKSIGFGKVDETSLSPSSSSAASAAAATAVSASTGTPKGLPALLNKMVRAVLISKPLQEVQFFADYLDAELNRRTLCQLQDLGMTVCDLEVFESGDIQSLSSRVIRAATREQCQGNVIASKDEQSANRRVRKPESKCVAVQTDRNHLRYVTRSPFLQKMEAELISSVVENLNQDHECRCSCPPPPLFWYQITRPQVLRKCRTSIAGPRRKKFLMSEVKPEKDTVEGDHKDVDLIKTKTAFSLDDKASKLRAANDAGLARIIDREMRLKEPPPHIPPPPPRPKTPPPIERPLKVDASSQVETLVIQPRPHLQKQETRLESELLHKYVQTMDEDDIFRPEEAAIPDHSDLPSEPIPLELDEPATIPHPDPIAPADASDEAVDWSPFSEPPLQRRSSTDWLNIQLRDVSEKDYDTDWSEMTRAVPSVPEEPVIDWLSIRPQPEPHKCGRASPPPPAQEAILDETAIQPPEDMPDVEGPQTPISRPESPAVQPTKDMPDIDGPQTPISRPESPARMMTPDAEDVLTGCEDPSFLLGPDEVNPVVVLQWTPIVIEPETGDAQPLDIPVIVSQCPEPSDEPMVHDRISTAGQDLDSREVVLQELIPKSAQVSNTEVVFEMPHENETPPEDAMVKQASDQNETSLRDETEEQLSSHVETFSKDGLLQQVSDHIEASSKEGMMKQVSDHIEASSKEGMTKQVSDHIEASSKEGMMKQVSDHIEVSLKGDLAKQVSDQNEVSPKEELVKQASDHNMISPKDDIMKQASEEILALSSDQNVLTLKDETLKQVSGYNEVSPKDELMKQVSDHKELLPNDDIVKQVSYHKDLSQKEEIVKQAADQNEVLTADKTVKPASEPNEESEVNEMLKQVFGEEVLSNSSMFKIETTQEDMTPVQTEFATTNEPQNSMPSPVLSSTSAKEKVSRSHEEPSDVESRRGAEGTLGSQEESVFGDTTKIKEKETTKPRIAELTDSGKLSSDKGEKNDQYADDGDKEQDRVDVEKPATNKEQM